MKDDKKWDMKINLEKLILSKVRNFLFCWVSELLIHIDGELDTELAAELTAELGKITTNLATQSIANLDTD